MHVSDSLAAWTMLPFVALVLGIAVLPIALPDAWRRYWFQALVIAICAVPIVVYLCLRGQGEHVGASARNYFTFICTLSALYVVAGGIYVDGDIEATPGTNTLFLIFGALLASVIGTTGASVLCIRPLLRTNAQREHKAHLVPFFILAVSNAGGLLTPLGDPPLLVGFVEGVPFTWTLKLFPVWLLYVGSFAIAFYFADRRAHGRESTAAITLDRREVVPITIRGRRNLVFMVATVGAVLLPPVIREICLLTITVSAFVLTPREVHRLNGFGLGPIAEVAILFIGLFVCLTPIELKLAANADHLPFHSAWQLFWVSGALSAVLDNAPTYAAFAALARAVSHGQPDLIAGITPLKLAAVSVGSVVMGATTYIGNGPNLVVRAIAEREHYQVPSFVRYALFAFVTMLPAHLIATMAFALIES